MGTNPDTTREAAVQHNDDGSVTMTPDEDLLSDIYDYLRGDRRMSQTEAVRYMSRLSELVPTALGREVRAFVDDGEPQLDWQGLRAGKFGVHYRSPTGDEIVVETHGQSPEDAAWKVYEKTARLFGIGQRRSLIRVERLPEGDPQIDAEIARLAGSS